MNFSSNLSVKYRAEVLRAGRIVEKREGRNLVVDGGLSMVNSGPVPFASWFASVRYGTSTNPVKRGSVGVTFTTTGSGASVTVTASAGFFIAADVGRILKLDTGEELRVGTYTSGTSVICSTDAVSVTQGQAGAIHYVNDTALGANATDLGNPSLSAGTSVFDSATATVTMTKGCDSAAATSAKTITEMGWFMNTGAMLGRVLLDSPIGLQIGDVIRLTLAIQLQYDTTAVVCGAGAFAGTSRFWGGIMNNALTYGINGMHPMPCVASPDISVIHNSDPPAGSGSGATATYTTIALGVWDVSFTQGVNDANGTFAGFVCGPFVHKLDAPFTKTNTQTLAITFRVSLKRTLTN